MLAKFNHVGPHFPVNDVLKAVAFYEKAFGFKVEYLNGDPPHYAVVFSGNVYIHLSHPEPPLFVPGGGRAFVVVDGVETLWERVQTMAPQSVMMPLKECDYGHGVQLNVFTIADPDGNLVRIGETLKIQ